MLYLELLTGNIQEIDYNIKYRKPLFFIAVTARKQEMKTVTLP